MWNTRWVTVIWRQAVSTAQLGLCGQLQHEQGEHHRPSLGVLVCKERSPWKAGTCTQLRAACIKILLLLGSSFSFSFPHPNAGAVTRCCRWPNLAVQLHSCSPQVPSGPFVRMQWVQGCELLTLAPEESCQGSLTSTSWLARCSSHCSRCPSLHGVHSSDQLKPGCESGTCFLSSASSFLLLLLFRSSLSEAWWNLRCELGANWNCWEFKWSFSLPCVNWASSWVVLIHKLISSHQSQAVAENSHLNKQRLSKLQAL